LRAFLIISDKALVHSLILFLHTLDSQYAIFQSKGLSILEPGDGLDRIALDGASEGRWSSKINSLRTRLDLRSQRCRNSQNGLHTLTADGIVDDAKVFTGIFNSGLTDDQSATDLTYALIQLNRLTPRCALDELVPSETKG